MNWKVLAIGALMIVPLVAVLAASFGTDPRGRSNELEGTKAPDFTLVTLTGERVALADLRGKPVVVNFWASWCIPCLSEHEHLLMGARSYGRRGVTFLGVLYGDEKENAVSWLREHGQAYPTLLDPANRTAIDYGVAGVPETFFIDPDGNIALKYTGPLTFGTLRQTLEPML